MNVILSFSLHFLFFGACTEKQNQPQERVEIQIIRELYRLRNEYKADSAEQFFADTVKVYMKYLRNVPKRTITESDRKFWKAHPKNKFEITEPIRLIESGGTTTAIVVGKEYLDGTHFQYERIEIVFNRLKKIISFRGFNLKRTK
jgi:hypothetical protein